MSWPSGLLIHVIYSNLQFQSRIFIFFVQDHLISLNNEIKLAKKIMIVKIIIVRSLLQSKAKIYWFYRVFFFTLLGFSLFVILNFQKLESWKILKNLTDPTASGSATLRNYHIYSNVAHRTGRCGSSNLASLTWFRRHCRVIVWYRKFSAWTYRHCPENKYFFCI